MKFQAQNLLKVPMFKPALEYRDRITFGHEKIDRILDLHFGAMFRIFGETRYSNALVTRLGLGCHVIMVVLMRKM